MTTSFPVFEDRLTDDVSIARDRAGGFWLAFSVSRLDAEYVVVRHIRDGEVAIEHELPGGRGAARPVVVATPDGCVVAYVTLGSSLGVSVAMFNRDGEEGHVGFATEHDVLNVALASTDERLWLACDQVSVDGFAVRLFDVEGGDSQTLEGTLRSPTLCSDGETTYLVCVEGKTERDVALFEDVDGTWRRVATIEDGTAEAPVVTVFDGEAVVAWHHGIGDGLRWLRAARLSGAELVELEVPEPPTFDRVDVPTDQGWEFPSLATHNGSVWMSGRSAHNFFVAQLRDDAFGPRTPQSADGWGGCGRKSQLTVVDGELCFARMDRRLLRVESVSLQARELEPGRPEYPHEQVAAPTMVERFADDGIQYGQMHQHSAHSDGTGSMWDMLLRAVHNGFDFTAMTDHDRFCGKAIGPVTWRIQQVVLDALSDVITTIHAIEFTGARHPGPGHKNIYFEGKLPEQLEDHTIEGLHKMLADHPAIVIPHHVGFTGWDIDHHDPELQPLWEICSVHGSYEGGGHETPFAARGDALIEDHTVRGALDRGLKFGFCAGADDHGLVYHHGTTPRRDPTFTGLTAVLDAPRTRAGILAAMRARRCYATTGAKIALRVTLDGQPMGSDVASANSLEVTAQGTAPIVAIDVLSSAGDHTVEFDPPQTNVAIQHNLDLAEGYVYVRVRQSDADMAWSSPFFISTSTPSS